MASATCSSASSSETVNYTCLCCLLVDVGVQALRDTFDKIHPPAHLHEVLVRPPAHPTLQSLKKKRILNPKRWSRLFPSIPSTVSSANFDATLLILLLKNICNLSPPPTGWDSLPPDEDISIEANIARLLFYRDEVYKHASQASVDNPTFQSCWMGISKALEGIAAGESRYEAAINRYKVEDMDSDFEEHYQELLKEWKNDDDGIKDKTTEPEALAKIQKANEDSTKEKMTEKEGTGTVENAERIKGTETDKNKESSGQPCHSSPPQLSIKLPKASDLPSTYIHWREVKLPIDILLLTVKKCEFISCFERLDDPFKSYCKEIGPVVFGSMGGGDQAKLKIALMQCSKGSAGPSGSLSTVKDAVRILRPKAVFSVGACSGLSPDRVKLGDIVVSSKLTTSAHKAPVSRNMGYLIQRMADGWVAPLENPSDLEVTVHCDGDILSRQLADRFGLQCNDIMKEYPEAIAFETEGEGVFAAAHDYNVEWVIVKGVASYRDTTLSSTDDWASFASTMAASLVANILSHPPIFQEWSHFNQDGFDVAEHINQIRQLYTTREGWLAPFPWCDGEFYFHLDDIFTRLIMVSREKTRGVATNKITEMSAILQPHEECSNPRTVLIEGKPGMGKTTYCNKIAYDWATKKPETGHHFQKFQLVLLLRCRDIDSNVQDAIVDQILPTDVQEQEREKFFEFIRHNQSNVLLVLDGLDELPEDKLPEFSAIIQGRNRILCRCPLVVTARHEAGIPVRKSFDTLLEIEGFTVSDAIDFIFKFFKSKGEEGKTLAQKLKDRVRGDPNLRELLANPLNTALLCLLCEDLHGLLPESRTQLYVNIVEFVLRRFKKKKELPVSSENLIEEYEPQLKHLGLVALNGLLEDKMSFEEKQLADHASDLPGFGFLSVQPGGNKRRPCLHYAFLHKSFQEHFAAYYLCCQLLNQEISPDSLAADDRYFSELTQVLLFTCGMLAEQSPDTAKALIKSLTTRINLEGDKNKLPVALECIKECKKEESNFHVDVARTFGSFLTLTELFLFHNNIGAAGAAALANALHTNTTLTRLHLSDRNIGDAGAAALANALHTNTTLTNLDLSDNNIGDAGAAALANALHTNTTLTGLHLSDRNIGATGAAALANALHTNTTLTGFSLFGSNIGGAGAAALANALHTNTTLTKLNLSDTNIGAAGAAALANALHTNTTLTEFGLFGNNIGDAGVVALANALHTNTTLTKLMLGCSNIGDAGAAALAYFCDRNKGDAGVVALANALHTNTTLTKLRLFGSGGCVVGDAGAAALANALHTNTTLTKLDLSDNNIGDAGAAALANALHTNTTLTKLRLCGSNIGDAGAAAFANALHTNTTLTKLDFSDSNIGDAGAAALANALHTNTSSNQRLISAFEVQ